MKKTIYALAGLIGCLSSLRMQAQTIKFPDPNFKLALISLGHDTNGDGEIQQAEAVKLKKLYVEKANISSLVGIKYFTNLEELGFYNNHIRQVDLEGMSNLRAVYGWSNEVAVLKIKGCPKLETIYMYENKLRHLDFTGLKNIKELKLDQNLFDEINLSNLPKLEELEMNNNKLTSFKAPQSPGLRTLKMEANYLFEVDLTPYKQLEMVYLTDNPLKRIDVRGLKSLKTLYCAGRKFPAYITQLNTCGLVSLVNYDW